VVLGLDSGGRPTGALLVWDPIHSLGDGWGLAPPLGTTSASAKPSLNDPWTLVIGTKNVEWGTLFAAQRVPSHEGVLCTKTG
jgi:hypothetical protein